MKPTGAETVDCLRSDVTSIYFVHVHCIIHIWLLLRGISSVQERHASFTHKDPATEMRKKASYLSLAQQLSRPLIWLSWKLQVPLSQWLSDRPVLPDTLVLRTGMIKHNLSWFKQYLSDINQSEYKCYITDLLISMRLAWPSEGTVGKNCCSCYCLNWVECCSMTSDPSDFSATKSQMVILLAVYE